MTFGQQQEIEPFQWANAGLEEKIPVEQFQAVAFDFDGILADTQGAHKDARQRAYNEMSRISGDNRFGLIPESIQGKAHLHGSTPETINAWILYQAGIIDEEDPTDPLVQEIVELKRENYGKIAARGLPLQRDARSFVQAAERQWPGVMGIVTTAHWNEVEPFINRHGFQETFPPVVVVKGEDVMKPKPDPEAYLQFAGRLHLDADKILVIEDSPRGIHAAKAAGCFVVGITFTHSAEQLVAPEFMSPDIIASSFYALKSTLGLNTQQQPANVVNGIDFGFQVYQ